MWETQSVIHISTLIFCKSIRTRDAGMATGAYKGVAQLKGVEK